MEEIEEIGQVQPLNYKCTSLAFRKTPDVALDLDCAMDVLYSGEGGELIR